MRTVISIVESSRKPVIAAIGGICMGGGLELSLGCHFRVALPDATVALPEVKLGLIPGAGGTQRLPRAVGVENALNMIVSGASVPARQLAATALFDTIVEGDLLEGAVSFARQVASEGRPLKRLRDVKIDFPDAQGFFQFARNMVGPVSRNLPAPLKCIDAVAASVTKPFDEGLQFERELFLQLVQTAQARALRHAFFAERAAAKVLDLTEQTSPRPVKAVAVIGAGTMGGGIAMNFLAAGMPVTILETSAAALDKGTATIRRNFEASQKKGRFKPEQVERMMALLKPTLAYDEIRSADLVIEAVFEDMAVKQDVFRKLDSIARPGAILATNTSTLDVDRIASATSRPSEVVGMHFFSPANVMKLLEVVRGKATGADVLANDDAAGEEDRKDRGRIARLRWLHRQPHARAIHAAGVFPAGGGCAAATGRRRARRLRHGDGSVPDERSRRQRHRLAHPPATLCRAPALRATRASATACASSVASARRPAWAGTATTPESATPSPIPRSRR